MSVEPLLVVRKARAHHGERVVVRDVDLEVRPGELWAVVGPNGAGKSTLMRTCLGLHPLAAGAVTLSGRPLVEHRRAELARCLAWVPQDAEAAIGFTALELVLLGRSPHLGLWGLPSSKDLALARAAMDELGVTALASRRCSELSGGERRLLLLARALAQEARLLVLDEPTAFLDLRYQVMALERVRARVEEGLGAIVVLHDVNLAAAFAHRTLLMKGGSVLAQGPTEQVLSSAVLEELFGLPMAAGEAGGQRVYAARRRG